MASKKGHITLLVLALVLPLGAANFLLNVTLTVFYLPAVAPYISTGIDTAARIFLPFALYVLALIFSIILIANKKHKEHALTLTALVLNAVLVVSGLFFVYSSYFL